MPARGTRGAAGVGRGARPKEAEVLQRLSALSLEQRRAALRFEDAALVSRVRTALQVLFERQTIMQQMCANMGCDGGDDAFEASVLLKQAFKFEMAIGRLASDPSVAVLNPKAAPVMTVKVAFLQDPEHLYQQMRGVLPDFLSPKAPRFPLPRARWKELWATAPTSIAALEQQLAKLTEQALWAMAGEPEQIPTIAEAEDDDGAVEMEPWMAEHDEEVKKKLAKKKKKNRKPKAQPTLEVIKDATWEPAEDLEDDGQEADDAEELEEEESAPVEDLSIFVEGSWLAKSLPVGGFHFQGEEDRSTPTSSGAAASSGALGAYDGDMPWCHRPPLTPPSSPLGTSRTWRPAQLVNYLWGQTSQLSTPLGVENSPKHRCSSSPSAAVSTHTPLTPMSCTSSQGTPWSRGQWMPYPQASSSGGTPRLVVRNTFIDMEVVKDGGTAGHRSSRSLSPSWTAGTVTPQLDGSPVSRAAATSQPSHPLPDEPGINEQWTWYWH